MRYFIISLCVNLVLLALPLKGISIENKKEETKVVLNEIKAKEEIKNEEIIKEIKEEPIEEKKEKIVKEIKKLIKKKSSKKPSKEAVKQQEQKTSEKVQKNEEKIIKEPSVFKIDDDFCKASLKLEEIDSSYPKKAKMLKKLGEFSVSVRFQIIQNKLKILSITGDKLFVSHTEKLFKKLDYKLLDSRASECIFVKKITYKLKG